MFSHISLAFCLKRMINSNHPTENSEKRRGLFDFFMNCLWFCHSNLKLGSQSVTFIGRKVILEQVIIFAVPHKERTP